MTFPNIPSPYSKTFNIAKYNGMKLQDIMTQGYDAFFDGESIDSNPYSTSSPMYRVWVVGYEQAKYGINMTY